MLGFEGDDFWFAFEKVFLIIFRGSINGLFFW